MSATQSKPRSRHRRRLSVGIIVATLVAAALVVGFVQFTKRVAALGGAEAPQADGIVVLTGGSSRIEEALKLLQTGKGRRLLISGVNPSTTMSELMRQNGHGAHEEMFDCCVDIGRRALDTEGNAAEAVQWARGHGFDSLTVVTSDYHMPRSMVEFSRQVPGDMRLNPYPIATITRDRILAEPQIVRFLVFEYTKYLLAVGRTFIMAPKPLTGQRDGGA